MYLGSRWVTIPLSTGYVVRSKGDLWMRLKLTAEQLASVVGIVTTQLYLSSVRCGSLPHLSCQCVLERRDLISWPAT